MVELDFLLKLQEIDLQLNEIRAEHGNIPLLVKELDKDVDELKEELEKQESELKASKLAVREAESKVALLADITDKYKRQLLTVKTNREYSALLTEIEAVKGEKDELEEQIIRNMEKIDEAVNQVKEKKGKLEEAVKIREEKKKELQLKMKSLETEIDVRGNKREKITVKIDRLTLKLYERIMKSRIKNAVVALRNGSCGGCFAMIPLQKVADIRKGKQIYTCDYCGRILYYDESHG